MQDVDMNSTSQYFASDFRSELKLLEGAVEDSSQPFANIIHTDMSGVLFRLPIHV